MTICIEPDEAKLGWGGGGTFWATVAVTPWRVRTVVQSLTTCSPSPPPAITSVFCGRAHLTQILKDYFYELK